MAGNFWLVIAPGEIKFFPAQKGTFSGWRTPAAVTVFLTLTVIFSVASVRAHEPKLKEASQPPFYVETNPIVRAASTISRD